MDIILNWRQACAALSISRPTLYALTNQGKLKRVKISTGRVGWPQSEISKYIEGLIAGRGE
ncbi:helix-turn-helix domain-containing protein [Alphaproteobacteria bacterium]|nr:helix-turn-helix domain-containing protein [Alphaproteobacteria bacterium]